VRQVVNYGCGESGCDGSGEPDATTSKPTTTVNVEAVEAAIGVATKALEAAQKEVDDLVAEIAAEKAEVDAIDDLAKKLDSLYASLGLSRRRRRSESAIKGIVDSLLESMDIISRRRRTLESEGIEWCPAAIGNVYGTAANLILQVLADIQTNIDNDTILNVSDCFLDLIDTLKAMNITVSEVEIQELQDEKDKFESAVEAAVVLITAAVEAKETELATQEDKVAELAETITNLNNKISTAPEPTTTPVIQTEAETTTIDGMTITEELFTATEQILTTQNN
ncbi:unnamed protein product, partial [Meganyctiphanes norvegica]